jgi:hypothetical protein
MKAKVIAAIALSSLSGLLRAGWLEVDWNEERTFYVDPETLRPAGALVRMSDLVDFKIPQVNVGKQFRSARSVREYDCNGRRVRRVVTTELSANMGVGDVIQTYPESAAWTPVPSETASEALWKLACGLQAVGRVVK